MKQQKILRNAHRIILLVFLVLFVGGCGVPTTQTGPADVGAVEVTPLEACRTGYATFGSNNQRVVSNAHGIFVSYLSNYGGTPTTSGRATWRLVRSTDGGKTFDRIFTSKAIYESKAPAIETDEQSNVYLYHSTHFTGKDPGLLYKFSAADNYATTKIFEVPNGSFGKYALLYDRPRKQLLLWAHHGWYNVMDTDGKVLLTERIIDHSGGQNANLQYPHLSLDSGGTLWAAWTTENPAEHTWYWDIHTMKSPDQGVSWQTAAGEPLATPVIPDDTGPADRITQDDEFESKSFLLNHMARNSKVHFVYRTYNRRSGPGINRFVYARLDVATGLIDKRITPAWGSADGKTPMAGGHGFFATRREDPNAPLYFVGQSGRRIVAVASYDNGDTWQTAAVSEEQYPRIYAVSGAREISADGYIVGAFTVFDPKAVTEFKKSTAYFLKIPTDLVGK